MIFVTFHGGKPEQHPRLNNVHAYDKNGKRITASLLDDAAGVSLDELRALCLRGDLLYVVNANKEQNSVLCYHGSGTKYHFVSTFASHGTCPGILHPFDLTFDENGFAYLSSQDTNLVTRFKVSGDGRTATPAPIAPALASRGKFMAGTFVASSVGRLTDPPTTEVAPPMGLTYSDTEEKKHSVRGVLWTAGALYVVDQPAGRVKVYDKNGMYLGQSNEIDSPVHLTLHSGRLYASGGNEVLEARLPNPPGNLTFSTVPGLRIKNGSGMAFTPLGKLYIASRTKNVIQKFGPDFRQIEFDCDLPDNPEFLLYVRGLSDGP